MSTSTRAGSKLRPKDCSDWILDKSAKFLVPPAHKVTVGGSHDHNPSATTAGHDNSSTTSGPSATDVAKARDAERRTTSNMEFLDLCEQLGQQPAWLALKPHKAEQRFHAGGQVEEAAHAVCLGQDLEQTGVSGDCEGEMWRGEGRL